MAEKFDLLVGVSENIATATGTAAATATQAAPGADRQLFITGFSVSCGVAPTTAGTLSIASAAGGTQGPQYLLPISVIAPIIYEFKRPIRCAENVNATAVVAGWTTATVRVELYTITRPVTV